MKKKVIYQVFNADETVLFLKKMSQGFTIHYTRRENTCLRDGKKWCDNGVMRECSGIYDQGSFSL